MNERQLAESLPDLEVMVRTLWGECRGESREGQKAVAWVIRNRADNPRWWGQDIKSVCLKPWQFSCWNPSDPQAGRMLSLSKTSDLYKRLEEVCIEVFEESRYRDPTNNSDHYLVSSIADSVAWSTNRRPEAVIGAHSFFRLELPSKEQGPPVFLGADLEPPRRPVEQEVEEEKPRSFWDRLFKRF